jgi:hypothetical protein
VLSHGACEVDLVGEAQVRGQSAKITVAVPQSVQRFADPDPVAIAGQADSGLSAEGAA